MNGSFRIKDIYGNDVYFGNGGDVWFPPTPSISNFRDNFRKVRQMEMRSDDVIISTYPRSGTHWHHQIVRMLLSGSVDYEGSVAKDHIDWNAQENLDPPDKPRLFVTHLRYQHLPRQVQEKKVKLIYAYRNPKDAWVSLYNFTHSLCLIPPYEGTWSQFFNLIMDAGYWYGDWFDHVLDWEQVASEHPDQIFISNFEKMKKTPAEQVMKINQFLGLNRGRELCEQIAEACQFSKLKMVKDAEFSMEDRQRAWRNGVAGLYRKGEIGDWKNWFTVEQNERFDVVFEKRMSDSKLEFIFQ